MATIIATRRDLATWAQNHMTAAGGSDDDAEHVVEAIQTSDHPAWGTDWADYLDTVDVVAIAADGV